MHADLHRANSSGTGTDCKDQYDSVVMQCLAKCPLLVLPDIDGQALGSASSVSDTHRARIAIAIYLPERLNLHRTGKRHEHRRRHVELLRHKTNR